MMSFDIEIAARTLWGEFRGESPEAIQAGAHCIANRHQSGRWFAGHTLAECCLKPFQFSSWNTNDVNRVAMARLEDDDALLAECRSYMIDVLSGEGEDPTKGSTHYYSTTMLLPPQWAESGEFTVQIGKTRFYKGVL